MLSKYDVNQRFPKATSWQLNIETKLECTRDFVSLMVIITAVGCEGDRTSGTDWEAAPTQRGEERRQVLDAAEHMRVY